MDIPIHADVYCEGVVTGRTTDAARQPPVATVENPKAQGRINRGEDTT